MPVEKTPANLQPDLVLQFSEPVEANPDRIAIASTGFAAENVQLKSVDAFDYIVQGHNHYLAIHDIVLEDGEAAVDGQPVDRVFDLRNTISFIPRGSTISGWSKPVAHSNSFTALHFSPEVLTEELALRVSGSDLRPSVYFRSVALEATLRKIQLALTGGKPDRLYLESLCMVAVCELMQTTHDPAVGCLSKTQLDSVLALIEAALHQDLSMADMAAVTNLSRFHFARAFKTTTGVSPYQFLLARRIEKSRQLLRSGDRSLDEIARAVGFNSSAQFGRAFRKASGETPHQFRRGR